MSTLKELQKTIDSLLRMKESCVIDGDIDAEYFDQLIQNIYSCKKWLTPELAFQAKQYIDFIEGEIRKSLRDLLKEGKIIPNLKKAKSAYSSFHSTRPIIGFDRNA